jgi:hypothetical protein
MGGLESFQTAVRFHVHRWKELDEQGLPEEDGVVGEALGAQRRCRFGTAALKNHHLHLHCYDELKIFQDLSRALETAVMKAAMEAV